MSDRKDLQNLAALLSQKWPNLSDDSKVAYHTKISNEFRAHGIPWMPMCGKQAIAFNSEADEIFYGGGAGSGKTMMAVSAAYMAAAGLLPHLGKTAAIFRRMRVDTRHIWQELKKISNGNGSMNASDLIWRGDDGAEIQLNYLNQPDDWQRVQGNPKELYIFDEVCEMDYNLFKSVLPWHRTSNPKVRPKILMTGNPPSGATGRWIVHYFAPWLDKNHPNPAKDGELRWFVASEHNDFGEEVEGREPVQRDGMTLYPKSRTVVRSTFRDNPYYVVAGYEATLQALPKRMRDAMMHGDFNADYEDDADQLVKAKWIDQAMSKWVEPLGAPISVGVDPTDGGGDRCVFVPRYSDGSIGKAQSFMGAHFANGREIAEKALSLYPDAKSFVVDSVGVGAATYQAFCAMGYEHITHRFLGGAESYMRTDFNYTMANKRAELYWKLRDLLDPEKAGSIALPPDEDLKAELLATYWQAVGTMIKIEDKNNIKKRLGGQSPDKADALCYALYASNNRRTVF